MEDLKDCVFLCVYVWWGVGVRGGGGKGNGTGQCLSHAIQCMVLLLSAESRALLALNLCYARTISTRILFVYTLQGINTTCGLYPEDGEWWP